MENKNILIFSAICTLIIGGVVGYQLGFSSGEKSSQAKIDKLLAVFPPTPEVLEISGSVKEVGDGYFVLESPKFGNPIEEFPTVRKVLLSPQTLIQQSIGGKLVDLQETDLQEGLAVSVSASFDIKALEKFEAVMVKIISESGSAPSAGGGFTPPPSVPAN